MGETITTNDGAFHVGVRNNWNFLKPTIYIASRTAPRTRVAMLGTSTALSLALLVGGCSSVGGSDSPSDIVLTSSRRNPNYLRAGHVHSLDDDRRTSGSVRGFTYLGESDAALEARVSGGLSRNHTETSSSNVADIDAKAAVLVDITERTDKTSPLLLDPGFALLVGPQVGVGYGKKVSGEPFAESYSSVYGGLRLFGLARDTVFSLDAFYGESRADLVQNLNGVKDGFSGSLSLGHHLGGGGSGSLWIYLRGSGSAMDGKIDGRLANGRSIDVEQKSYGLGVDGALIYVTRPVYFGPKGGVSQTETENKGSANGVDRAVQSYGAGLFGVDFGKLFGGNTSAFLEVEGGVRYNRTAKDVDPYVGASIVIPFGN